MPLPRGLSGLTAGVLLFAMFLLAGGAAWRESATVDEVAHVGAGLSYVQRLDLRLNPEHPPLAKVLAAVPLAVRGAHADYSSNAWKLAESFFPAYMTQWMFGDAVLGRWNGWKPTLLWARLPMLILTLLLGWVVYVYARRFGESPGGLLCLALYAANPAFLAFGPLVITDLPVTLFSLIALWQFGEIWASPSRKTAVLFGLALAASLLSKFSGLLLLPVVVAVFVQTRIWPSAAEPTDKSARRAWRRARWRSTLAGVLYAAAVVYMVYFILSMHQPDDALNRIGGGAWAGLLRRPLMPVWLYTRGLLLMLITASRPTFLLGHAYPHGVPFYFPVVFVLKSPLGFLLLLALAAVVGFVSRRSRIQGASFLPEEFRPHWRILMVAFFVFLIACLLSRLDISIRHFLIPIVLLILMLSPLPKMIGVMKGRRALQIVTAGLVASCFVACFLSYPYFMPFVNSLTMGRPVYALLNDSNVSWNEGLPAVKNFVQGRGLRRVKLDWASLSDPALVVPQAQAWDCQAPEDQDAGQWVIVAAVSILENRNCGYLLRYPHQALAGGGMYAFQLPRRLPAPGALGGPPQLSARKVMWEVPFDIREFALDAERHPDKLPTLLTAVMRRFQQPQPKGSQGIQ